MLKEQQQVAEFMSKAGQATPQTPVTPDLDTRKLRVTLIAEELVELAEAYGLNLEIDGYGNVNVDVASNEVNIVEAYDAVIDLMVVTIGTGVANGTDIEPGWEVVHKSNMAKFAKGGYRRPDGKWMKPPGWKPPELAPILSKLSGT